MKYIDQKAVSYGMPIELMMENAGREICNQILKKLRKIISKKFWLLQGMEIMEEG